MHVSSRMICESRQILFSDVMEPYSLRTFVVRCPYLSSSTLLEFGQHHHAPKSTSLPIVQPSLFTTMGRLAKQKMAEKRAAPKIRKNTGIRRRLLERADLSPMSFNSKPPKSPLLHEATSRPPKSAKFSSQLSPEFSSSTSNLPTTISYLLPVRIVRLDAIHSIGKPSSIPPGRELRNLDR